MTIKVYIDMSALRDYQMKAAMKLMWSGFGFFLGLIALVVVVGSASAAEPTDPTPLTFTKFIQLMKIEHKIEPGIHKIFLTWQQKEATAKIPYPMFAPLILCAQFPELAGQTLIVAAFGETEMVHTCD